MPRQDNIIHICNNYVSSKVHSRLIASVDDQFDLFQEIYVPVRRRSDVGANFLSSSKVDVTYDYCIPAFIKFLPLLKVLWVSCRFYLKVYRKRRGLVVAHSLWSDGFPAFLCSTIFGGSYSVYVRGTDINFFLPKLPHYRFIFCLIIRRADNVIFVSPAHQLEFKRRYPYIFKFIKKKVVLPNGVDLIWLDNIFHEQASRKDLLFVGRFDKNKNIDMVINVYQRYSQSNPGSRLRLVGGDANELIDLLKLQDVPSGIEVLGKINDCRVLQSLYRTSAVLLVPSKSETFGLVYIEALSQGCPVVHTKGQGVAGYFDGCDYVFPVDCEDVDDLFKGVSFLTERYPMGVPATCFEGKLKMFSWRSISYKFVYELFEGQL